ncbi:MAG: cytochrome c family protein [Terricaulis sp.]
MRAAFAIAALLALTACGQPKPPEVDPAKQAAVAALPAPYNAASYAEGRNVFRQCRSCHVIAAGAPHRAGPNLHGVFGRHIGTSEGFTYSQAVRDADFVWDADHLDHWLQNPQTFLPGNRMGFAGVHDDTERRDLIAYLMVESGAQ